MGLRRRLGRLFAPAPKGQGPSTSPLRLPGADWAWRPGPWAGGRAGGGIEAGALPRHSGLDLGDGVRLFHDADAPGIAVEWPQAGTETPMGLRLRLDGFDGGFLSLAIALPAGALRGLGRRHLLGVEADLGPAGAPRAFARLNLRQGPNSEALLRGLPETGPTGTEFDLWTAETDLDRVEQGWIDLIFEAPLPDVLVIDDLLVARRPRAML